MKDKEKKAASDDELLMDNLAVFCVGVLVYIGVLLHTFDCSLAGLRNII